MSRLPTGLKSFPAAGAAVTGALGSFLPSSFPYLARRSYALEFTATFFFAIALAMVEGGIVSVFAKNTFSGVVETRQLNLTVAFLGAVAELANLLSFIWSGLSHGRPKVKFINWLQVATIVSIGLIAFLPRSPAGLYLLAAAVFIARVCWSGIITIRPTVWRANYPRSFRARVVGKLSSVQMLVVAVVGAALGMALDLDDRYYKIAVPIYAVIALGAVATYSQIRVRREDGLIRDEKAGSGPAVLKPWQGPLIMWRVLRRDRFYAQFQWNMFVLGIGNLMLTPILVITLSDRFRLDYFASILIASSIPAVTILVSLPFWSRLLDRWHVVKFRSVHSWTFVASGAVILLASWLQRVELMYLGAALQGIGFGGGALAWNLGHVDFAPPQETSQYMATHVTLNGIRGLLGPFFAVGVYEWFKAQQLPAATLVFAIALVFTIAGAVGFVRLRVRMGALARPAAR